MIFFLLLCCTFLDCSAFSVISNSRTTNFRLLAMTDDNATESLKKKMPWEFGRFVKTLTYYDVVKLPWPFGKASSDADQSVEIFPGYSIWSSDKVSCVGWGPLDDVVMGGASKSDLSPGATFDGNWTGSITTANNGGFAGIRTKRFQPTFDASKCRGFVIKLKGDGQRYKFIARDDDEWNGIAWSYSFDTTPGKTVDVKIPFSKLVPTKFAKTLPGYAAFNSKHLTGIQLSLSKFEYDGGLNKSFREGAFKLNLQQVSTF